MHWKLLFITICRWWNKVFIAKKRTYIELGLRIRIRSDSVSFGLLLFIWLGSRSYLYTYIWCNFHLWRNTEFKFKFLKSIQGIYVLVITPRNLFIHIIKTKQNENIINNHCIVFRTIFYENSKRFLSFLAIPGHPLFENIYLAPK